MNAIYLTLFGLTSFYLGYRFYSKYISEKIYDINEEMITPAHEFNDGLDFVHTNKFGSKIIGKKLRKILDKELEKIK